ncbi:MAG: muconolactone Delta-isomerase family protein [Actinomycetes bacterium]
MATFMVICTFRQGTVMDEVFAVVAEETAQVKALQAQGRIGAIHLSLARGTVFLEIFADDRAGAEETVRTLPMAKWWDLDVFPIGPPATTGGAS